MLKVAGKAVKWIGRGADEAFHTPIRSSEDLLKSLRKEESYEKSFNKDYRAVYKEKALYGYRYTGKPGDWGTPALYLNMKRAELEQGLPKAIQREKYLFPPGWYTEGTHSGFMWNSPDIVTGGGIQLWSPGVQPLLQKSRFWWWPL
jgi:hypothetical protein